MKLSYTPLSIPLPHQLNGNIYEIDRFLIGQAQHLDQRIISLTAQLNGAYEAETAALHQELRTLIRLLEEGRYYRVVDHLTLRENGMVLSEIQREATVKGDEGSVAFRVCDIPVELGRQSIAIDVQLRDEDLPHQKLTPLIIRDGMAYRLNRLRWYQEVPEDYLVTTWWYRDNT